MTGEGTPPAGGGAATLTVASELMADGTYGISITVGPDHAWPLDPDRAAGYAVACCTSATRADHEAAVFRLFTERMGMPEATAAQAVNTDLRSGPSDHSATEPLRFLTGYNRTYGPFVLVTFGDVDIGRLSPDDLRAHAVHVLDARAASALDEHLYRVLVEVTGLEPGHARAIVSTLGEHWPGRPSPVDTKPEARS